MMRQFKGHGNQVLVPLITELFGRTVDLDYQVPKGVERQVVSGIMLSLAHQTVRVRLDRGDCPSRSR